MYGSQAKRTNMVDPPFIHLSYLAVLICAWAAFFHPPGCPPPWLCCTFHFDKLLFTYVYFNDSFHSSFFLVWCSFLAKHAFGVALCVGRFHPSGSVRLLFFFSTHVQHSSVYCILGKTIYISSMRCSTVADGLVCSTCVLDALSRCGLVGAAVGACKGVEIFKLASRIRMPFLWVLSGACLGL